MSEMNKYPVLTPKMIRKLRMLTLLSIAATTRVYIFDNYSKSSSKSFRRNAGSLIWKRWRIWCSTQLWLGS